MHDVPYQHTESHYEYVVDTRDRISLIKRDGFAIMDQVSGWCSHLKGSVLIDLILAVYPKKVVEIGVWGGKSLLPIAYAMKVCECGGKIYGIDPWSNAASLQGVMHESNREFWRRVDHDEVLRVLEQTIFSYGLEDQVELIRSTSVDAPIIEEIDILHIDGNHSEETSYIDVLKWVPLVKKGGWIIFDDLDWFENGVTTTGRAVEYLNTHCHKIAEIKDSCLWGIWYKP